MARNFLYFVWSKKSLLLPLIFARLNNTYVRYFSLSGISMSTVTCCVACWQIKPEMPILSIYISSAVFSSFIGHSSQVPSKNTRGNNNCSNFFKVDCDAHQELHFFSILEWDSPVYNSSKSLTVIFYMKTLQVKLGESRPCNTN